MSQKTRKLLILTILITAPLFITTWDPNCFKILNHSFYDLNQLKEYILVITSSFIYLYYLETHNICINHLTIDSNGTFVQG